MKCIIKALSETDYLPRAKWWGYVHEGKRHLMRYHHRWAVFSATRVLFYDYETGTDKAGVEFALHYFKNHFMKAHTFALLKPDTLISGKTSQVLKILEEAGFTGTEFSLIQNPTPEQVEAHLADLKGKNLEAYGRNYGFLLNGPVLGIILTREDGLDPVQKLREVIGSTDPIKAAPGTIRSLSTDSLAQAEAEGRGCNNLIHASDSTESAKTEIEIWFGKAAA